MEAHQSGHVKSTVGMHDLACDEASAIGGKKDDDVGDVRGLGHRAERDKPLLFKQISLAELVARLCRVGETRGDSIDANTMRGECKRHRAGEADDASLAGRVVGTKDVAAHRRGRQIDDGTPSTVADHAARDCLSSEEAPLKIDVVDVIPLRFRQLQEWRTRKDSGIVDENVESSKRRIGLFDEENDYAPVLLDWRAPAARAFYVATAASPENMRRRRQFHTRGRQVGDFTDDVLGRPSGGERGDAALLAAHRRNHRAPLA